MLFTAVFSNAEFQICLAQDDGLYEFITYGALVYGQPWSPDKTQLIVVEGRFSSTRPPGALAIVDLTTGNVLDLQLGSNASTVYWSPDGKHILYNATDPSPTFSGRLALYDIENRSTTFLTASSALISVAGWSSDSTKIAFVSDMDGSFDLYVLDVETQVLQQLTNDSAVEAEAKWSPVDDRLLYGTTYHELYPAFWPDQVYKLYLTNSQGSDITLIGDEFYEMITWSPGGDRIAFVGRGTCILDLASRSETCYRYPPKEGDTLLASLFPAWSPDGRKLAFWATGPERCYHVLTIDIESVEEVTVDLEHCLTSPGPLYWLPNREIEQDR